MKQTYKMTTTKLDGYIQVTYINEFLNTIEINFKKPMTSVQFDSLIRLIPYGIDLDRFRLMGLHVEEVKEMPANKKIALFCKVYEQYKGIKYKASRRDGGLIKQVVINEDLLKHYFESEKFNFKDKQSVYNLVCYYNELLQDIAAKKKPKFPNTWSQDYANKLSPAELSDYWKHMRSLGLKPKKDISGNVIDWL